MKKTLIGEENNNLHSFTVGVVRGLSIPSLVEVLSTSCREGRDGRSMVQCPGVIDSDAAD